MNSKINILIITLFIGCNSVGLALDEIYRGKYEGYNVSLEINSDSTFTLTKSYVEWPKKCSGKWSEISENKYLLKCDFEDPNITPTPRMDYLKPREHILVILSKKKVKLEGENMILKRVK